MPQPVCEKCGDPVALPGARCNACVHDPPAFRQLRSCAVFADPLRPALHKLKYRRDLGLGEALIPQIAAYAAGLDWHVEVLVPVPLAAGRQKERGYNQAALIGWPLSLSLGIEFCSSALSRIRETRTQVGLGVSARHANVRGAFKAEPAAVANRGVLLVDDVATTGATLSSCAEALYAAGARDVFALTAGRAHRNSIHGA